MKKRLLSLLLVLILLLGLFPSAALAADSATVSFTAQAAGAFLCAPKFDVNVERDLAERYGYTDQVADGVSALDVLVKAHEMIYPNFAENTADFLSLNESGFITKVFGYATSDFGFMINGEMPNDGVLKEDAYSPGGKSYTGYGIAECPVENDDTLEFFLYRDKYYLDNYGWAEYQGSKAEKVVVRPEASVSLSYKGYCVAYYGCVPMDALTGLIEAVEGAHLAWVNTESGTLTDIATAVTDAEGKASFTAPSAEGSYYLTAYVTEEDITENYATPLVMSLVEVVVDENAPQPEPPAASAELTALSVADLESNPNALTMTPAFSSEVTAYTVEPVNFQQYAKMAYVKATAASETAAIKASLNGTEKDVVSGDAYWTAFNNMQPGEDNVLTITVTDGELSKTYTVTIPMKAQTVPVTGISLDKSELTLAAGETSVLTAAVEPDNATDKTVTWTTDNAAVATVENGTVTAVAAGTAIITAAAGEKSASCTVTVTAPLPTQPENNITVYFTLLGDSKHGDPTGKDDTHTLNSNNLETWIAKTGITVPQDSKVIDVVVKALALAGIPYENPTGNYISSIRGLAEFDNGTNSGWMYTLNGVYPSLGVSEQTVKNGDAIVFHYTDDYTAEKSSEGWNEYPSSSGGGSASGSGSAETGTATVKPEVTVTNGEAKAEVTAKNIADAITAAKKDGSDAIVIAPVVKGSADKIAVKLPKNAVEDIVSDTNAALNIQTDVGALSIPNDTLDEIVKAAGGADITMSIEKVEVSAMQDKLPEAVNVENAVAVNLTIASGDKTISTFGGKALEVRIPVDAAKYTSGKNYIAFIVSDNGSVERTAAAIVDGNAVITMRHFSTVVVTGEALAQFADVAADEYYYDAVLWAVAKGITDGTSDTTFSPDAGCTRAQMVTFLWRAAGSPEPAAKTNPFADVDETAYYFKALLWAIENGITDGTSETTFSPDEICTRAQMAAFLYRNAKSPAVSGTSDFADVKSDSYFSSAVVWAAKEGITDGTSDTTFSPDATCTRGQMVTFLYRYFEE